MYDRYCLKMSKDAARQRLEQGRRFVIRLKVPSGSTAVCDDLLGKVCFKNRTIDDQVLLKSDGTPTYHLASVVDDHLMGITHVIRGEEWLASTPKHLMLYRAFGWQEPKFLHLPLLLNEDRAKLSKRHAHTSVQWYKDQGYLPEAVANFVAFLGWTPPMSESTREILTLEEMARLFDVKDLNKSGAMVQLKKLNWLNSQHLKRLAQDDPQTLLQRLAPYLEQRLDMSKASPEYLKRVFVTLILQDTKFCTIPQLIERSLHFFVSPDYQSGEASATLKRIVRPYTCHLLDAFLAAADPPEWSKSHISGLLLSVLKSARTEAPDAKKADLYQVIRLALTGLAEGVDLLVTIEILGRKTCIERVASFRRLPSLSDAARERCRSQEDLAS
ncbi:glutamate--tRNA ligase-like [Schistocerca gregaria]|uniref:glutamate--tRNA ligase-like n=1 Tax=Schistocerca gregaria TaxID=7010 RepID=UPI00211E348A|nr:glutamate--tRNA ligase-like [Schistocerca gregaria]